MEAYREKLGNGKGPLPYRKLAELIGDIFSAQELQYFESGRQAVGIVGLRKLARLYHDSAHDDWRHSFAADLTAATIPDGIAPEGEIGKAVLGKDSNPPALKGGKR